MKSADLSSWKCRWFLTWLLCFKGTVTHLEKYKCFTFPFCQNHKWTECICIILSAGDSFPTCQCPRRSWHVCFSSCLQAMWKPAYDFLVTWAAQIGDSYRDVIQELHMGLDKMKNPITKRWKHLTGTLILVNCLDILRSSAFSPSAQDDYAIWTQALPHTSTPCSSGAIFFFFEIATFEMLHISCLLTLNATTAVVPAALPSALRAQGNITRQAPRPQQTIQCSMELAVFTETLLIASVLHSYVFL